MFIGKELVNQLTSSEIIQAELGVKVALTSLYKATSNKIKQERVQKEGFCYSEEQSIATKTIEIVIRILREFWDDIVLVLRVKNNEDVRKKHIAYMAEYKSIKKITPPKHNKRRILIKR